MSTRLGRPPVSRTEFYNKITNYGHHRVFFISPIRVAEEMGISSRTVRRMLADLVMVDQNPVANLKVLYGTGWVHVNDDTGAVERIGGVKYVVKDGIVYDAKKLLADVEKIVAEAKKK